MKRLLIIFALVTGPAIIGFAQTTSNIVSSQVKQSTRIRQGIASGALTKQEMSHLKRQQKHIQTEKRIARADGVVTKRERAQIRRDQKIANRSIYRQKHDAQSRTIH